MSTGPPVPTASCQGFRETCLTTMTGGRRGRGGGRRGRDPGHFGDRPSPPDGGVPRLPGDLVDDDVTFDDNEWSAWPGWRRLRGEGPRALWRQALPSRRRRAETAGQIVRRRRIVRRRQAVGVAEAAAAARGGTRGTSATGPPARTAPCRCCRANHSTTTNCSTTMSGRRGRGGHGCAGRDPGHFGDRPSRPDSGVPRLPGDFFYHDGLFDDDGRVAGLGWRRPRGEGPGALRRSALSSQQHRAEAARRLVRRRQIVRQR